MITIVYLVLLLYFLINVHIQFYDDIHFQKSERSEQRLFLSLVIVTKSVRSKKAMQNKINSLSLLDWYGYLLGQNGA